MSENSAKIGHLIGAGVLAFLIYALTEPAVGGEAEPMWGVVWCVRGAGWAGCVFWLVNRLGKRG